MDRTNLDNLNSLIDGLLQDQVAVVFIYAIIGILVLALTFRVLGIGRRFIALTPTALTTIGIIGTFLGILLGLAEFNPNRIDESVPDLIDGMKLAFGTSIAGVTSALGFRAFLAIIPAPNAKTDDVQPRDILNELSAINKNIAKASEENQSGLSDLRQVISSENDSSLITQMQKLRTTVSDGQADLIQEFREFASHMTENNQKALIEALESVIRDFNEKLTEQFGENFKQLNQAVEKLVIWQDEYRQHLETFQQRLEAAVDALESSETALASVRDSTAKIPEAIETLDPTTRMLLGQLELLQEALTSIETLREKTDTAYPLIEDNLSRITSGFADNVTTLLAKSGEAIERSEKVFTDLSGGYQSIIEGAEEAQGKFATAIGETTASLAKVTEDNLTKHGEIIQTSATQLTELAEKQFNKQSEVIENSSNQLAEVIKTAVNQSDTIIQEAWKDASQKIAQQFENFDKETQDELQRVLELLGKSLASVSEKFVADYTPLTDKLRELVDVARRAG